MGQSNILFIDGHVESLEATEIGRLAANAEIYGNGTW
jgi:prepilin-type processing-associated H-X9-DG protein